MIAVDIQREMLDIIAARMVDEAVSNIELVPVSERDPGLFPQQHLMVFPGSDS